MYPSSVLKLAREYFAARNEERACDRRAKVEAKLGNVEIAHTFNNHAYYAGQLAATYHRQLHMRCPYFQLNDYDVPRAGTPSKGASDEV